MSGSSDSGDLDKRIDLLKKDFEILQANFNSALTEMRADLAKQDATLSERSQDASLRLMAIMAAAGGVAYIVGSLIWGVA